MNYTLVIPAWNEESYLPSTLQHAKQAMSDCTYAGHLVVVDNNSTDDTAGIATAAGATVVFEPENQIARARNAGAAVADTDALVFLDADTTLTVELLQSGLDALASNAVVAGGVLIALDEPATGSAQWVLNVWNFLSQRFKLAAGSFIFCRRDAFEAIGGFDTRLYAGEELVLTRRLTKWGKKRGLPFLILPNQTIKTSARKLNWYSRKQLLMQFVMVLIPGALCSKRLCHTWYDKHRNRR
jgi:glycosyltransferase involved in cell wall biosynthesis